jgi:hypothetical protein
MNSRGGRAYLVAGDEDWDVLAIFVAIMLLSSLMMLVSPVSIGQGLVVDIVRRLFLTMNARIPPMEGIARKYLPASAL